MVTFEIIDTGNPDDPDVKCPECGHIQNIWTTGCTSLYCIKCGVEATEDCVSQK
jgi:ribosomal protein S27E